MEVGEGVVQKQKQPWVVLDKSYQLPVCVWEGGRPRVCVCVGGGGDSHGQCLTKATSISPGVREPGGDRGQPWELLNKRFQQQPVWESRWKVGQVRMLQ